MGQGVSEILPDLKKYRLEDLPLTERRGTKQLCDEEGRLYPHDRNHQLEFVKGF